MADCKTIDIECPGLLTEWDYEKNGALKPENVRKYSGKSVWWKCENGHNWKAPVARRSSGSVCPYCYGRMVLAGYNDIATTHPKIAAQWNKEKNGKLKPTVVSAGSNKKVWWICEKGHTWEAVVHSRTRLGCGCPYCEGKKPIKGETDLLAVYPNIAEEWDCDKNIGLKPEDVTAHSSRFAWWKCKNGHSWRTQIHVRTSGHECPYCGGFKAIQGENDLKTLRPDLAKEWDYEKNGSLLPENVKCSSNIKVWWKCSRGHTWRTTIAHRNAGQNCPYCGDRKVLTGYNDIATTHRQLIDEWDFDKNTSIQPENVSAGSNKKVWWKCELEHSWQATVCERTSRKNNCPYCSGRRVLKGYNDLATTHPDLAAQWDFVKNKKLTPEQVTAGSNKEIWWKCGLGHSWKAVVYSRTGNHASNCPYCVNHTVLENFNDLKTLNSDLAGEWDYEKNYPLRPENVTKSSNVKAWWICDQGHSYAATIANRSYGKNCPYCEKKRPIVGETDLRTTHPHIAKEWDREKNGSKRPEHYTCGSNISIWWMCKNGHSWKATICERNDGCNCPSCYGRTQMRTRLVR